MMGKVDSRNQPNLFSYGCKELTQDAMICWLLDWANRPEEPLGKVGRSFLRLFATKIPLKVAWADLDRIEIQRQLARADVIAMCRFRNDAPLCLVIEDKIAAALSGANQIERNRRNVAKKLAEEIPSSRILTFLFKSGFDYDWCVPANCYKVNYADIDHWLRSLTPSQLKASEVLASWAAFLKPKCEEITHVARCAKKIAAGTSERGQVLGFNSSNQMTAWQFQYQVLKAMFAIVSPVSPKSHENGNERTIIFGDDDATIFLTAHHGVFKGSIWIGINPFFYKIVYRKDRWVLFLCLQHEEDWSLKKTKEAVQPYVQSLRELGITVEERYRQGRGNSSEIFAMDLENNRGLDSFLQAHRRFKKWVSRIATRRPRAHV